MWSLDVLPAFVIEIVICVILLLSILLGLKQGIFKKLFNLVCFVGLILLLWLGIPPLARALEGTGWIQNAINNASFSEEIKGIFANMLGPTFYSFIAGLVLLLAFGIVKIILNIIFRGLFKKKGVITRVLGGVYGLLTAFIVSSIILICLASPTLFGTSGITKIEETTVTKYVYKGTVGCQELLKKWDLPYDLESVGARALAGKDATKEDRDRYASTISRLPQLKDELMGIINDGNVNMDKYIDADGKIKQEEASLFVDDAIVIADLVNKLPDEQKASAVGSIETALASARDAIIVDGKPKDRINVTKEQRDSLTARLSSLGINDDLIKDLDKCLNVSA